MHKLELLIFDLDGTLIDSKYDLTDAVNHAIAPLNRPALDYDELPGLLGSGLRYLLEVVSGSKDEAVLMAAKKRFDLYYEDNFAQKTKLYPGVFETINQLNQRYQLAIYSNKLQYFTSKITEALSIASFFDIVQGAAPDQYPLKPHPAGISRILSKLGIASENAMMIGDSTHDMEAGEAANVKTCAVTYGYRPAATLKAANPDYIIDNFPDLLKVLT